MTGYEPVDGTNALDDGFADCSLIIYPTCANDEVRDSEGQCRKTTDCSLECDGGTGEVQVGFGICQCDAIVKVEDLCTIECREQLVQKTFSDSNQIILTDPVTNTTIISELKNTLGSMNCISKDSNNCKLDNVFMTDEA